MPFQVFIHLCTSVPTNTRYKNASERPLCGAGILLKCATEVNPYDWRSLTRWLAED